jgi:FkbM family methyltransferase
VTASSLLKAALHSIGLDVRLVRNIAKAQRRSQEERWLKSAEWLSAESIQTILDIGANTGQFARLVHSLFPAARIYSFEPLPECQAELRRTLGSMPGAVAVPYALGDEEGTIAFRQSAFSPSSSFLEMTDVHRTNWPQSVDQSTVMVRVARLDDFVAQESLEDGLLVKMDVQGFEDRVIRGGMSTISRARIVLVEVSFIELYAGQPLFDDIYCQLQGLGFEYRGNLEQHASRSDATILFADAVFLKKAARVSRSGSR